MSKRNPFTRETVERAIKLREDEGVIRSWTYDLDRKRYLIDIFDFGHWQGNLRETWSLVVGMRAAQVHIDRGEP